MCGAALNRTLVFPSLSPPRPSPAQAICILMAVVVSSLSAWTLLTAPELERDFYLTTPVTSILVRVAVAFFVWDVYVCCTEWAGWAYLAHACACLLVFAAALKPTLHYMAAVTLLFEASTPFLHARRAMIQAQSASGPLFQAVQLAFAASFFLARIGVGYWKCGVWWLQTNAVVASGGAHNPAIFRMYQALCLFLCGLNGWWGVQILAQAGGSGASPVARGVKKRE